MIEIFKNIFEGLDRAHGVTLVGESNGDGNKIKGKSFVKREPVTDDLWQKHLDGVENLVQSGVKAVIQPAGSIRDKEIINFANKTNTILVYSRTRHFKH